MKYIFANFLGIVLLLIFSRDFILCQKPKQDLIYFEIGGTGIIYSINYDRRFTKSQTGLGIKIGVTSTKLLLEFDGDYLLPIHLNYVIGNKVGLELAAGVTISNFTYENVLPSASVMLRYQSQKGLNLRIGVAPYSLKRNVNNIVYWWPGLSVGYTF
jgi:hypothetical protein